MNETGSPPDQPTHHDRGSAADVGKGRPTAADSARAPGTGGKAADHLPQGADAQRAHQTAESDRLRQAYLASQRTGEAGSHGAQAHGGGTPAGRHDTAVPTARGHDGSAASTRSPDVSRAQQIRQNVRDAAGINVDVHAQPHATAPDVRAEKGVTGADVQSAHLGPTSALRDTAGYVRGEALTTLLSKETHHAIDKQWQAVFRDMANKGRTEITVRELYQHVAEAISKGPKDLTHKERATLEGMLHRELYGERGRGGLELQPGDKVRLPYAKGPMGSGPADKHPHAAPAQGQRIEQKGPALNERGEVIGSKAEGATARMEARERAGAVRDGVGQPATGEITRPEPARPATTGPGEAKAVHDVPSPPPTDRLAAEPGLGGRVLRGLGVAGELVGHVFDAAQMYFEGREVLARERPELLPEGIKVQLTMPRSRLEPTFAVPSGYSVEKTQGRVIYRDETGHEVPRDEAIKNSEGNKEDRDRRHTA